MIEPTHPAVILINGIGDNIISLPAVRALADLFPGKLTLVCRAGAHATFFGSIRFRTICETSFSDTKNGRAFDTGLVGSALKGCDLLLSLNPWHSGAVDELLRLVTPRNSIGYFRQFGLHLPLDFQKHSADLAFEVPRFLDSSLRIDDYSYPPHLHFRAISVARAVLEPLPSNWRVMVLHADTGTEKMWPPKRFVRVLDEFLRKYRQVLVLVLGSQDLSLDSGRAAPRVVPCYGLPLSVSAALIACADLFLGIDSSLLHIADFFRVPGVGLYGPTNPHEFGFRFGPHRHLWDRSSISNITVDDVLESLDSLVTYHWFREGIESKEDRDSHKSQRPVVRVPEDA